MTPRPGYLSTDEDDSSDEYGVSASTRRRAKRRSSSDSLPTAAEIRFSTRRAARVTNYNEDDADLEEEEDAEAVAMYGYQEEGPEVESVDLVLAHRPKEGIESGPKILLEKDQLEFHVSTSINNDLVLY